MLRDYQADAVDSVLPLNPGVRKLIVIPTGGGKSWIIAALAELSSFGGRCLLLTHDEKLIQQDADKIRRINPMLDVGIYCAKAKKREHACTITVASIQSVYKILHLWKDVSIVLVDEAHRITPVGGKLYRAVLDYFALVPIVGLTATPFRSGTGFLHKGPFKLFDEISYEISYAELVHQGHLVPFAEQGSDLAFDTSKLHIRAGEFIPKELDGLVDGAKTQKIVTQIIQRAKGRKYWLMFAINRRHAEMIAGMLNAAGVPSAAVHSDMPNADVAIAGIMADFEAGFLRAVICVNMFTTGYDFPALDCVVLFRPFASALLYVQCTGRVVRIFPGKVDGLLLDYGGNIARHGHFEAPIPQQKSEDAKGPKKECLACGEANPQSARHCFACRHKFTEMFKQCPTCGNELDINARSCPCGYEYPVKEDGLDENGVTIVPNKALWLDVTGWEVKAHTPRRQPGNPPKPDCLKITHITAQGAAIDEYIFPEYTNSRRHFERWWDTHRGSAPYPKTSREATKRKGELRQPFSIKVIRKDRFFTFLGKDFGDIATKRAATG